MWGWVAAEGVRVSVVESSFIPQKKQTANLLKERVVLQIYYHIKPHKTHILLKKKKKRVAVKVHVIELCRYFMPVLNRSSDLFNCISRETCKDDLH